MQVKKRNNRVVEFDRQKIERAVHRAMKEVHEGSKKIASEIADNVIKGTKKKDLIDVEEIQDLVEITLLEHKLINTARAYIVYRDDRRRFREQQQEFLGGTKTRYKGSLNAIKIIASRYANKRKDGSLESPEEIFMRVARALADVESEDKDKEKWVTEFYEVMWRKKFIPAGRTLKNAGSNTPLIPNCLVLDIEDSMEGILKTLTDAALHQQVGCGLGFPFHRLRPAGTRAKRTEGEASGPITFLRAYDAMFGTIKQQNRNGANMATFSVEHPDILDFISCKTTEGDIRNFNISVLLTDEFMMQAKKDNAGPWKTKWNGKERDLQVVHRNKFGQVDEVEETEMTAKQLLRKIAEQAWLNGEPGVFFYDRLQETNPLPEKGTLEATNPCGEQALHHGANCNLGSINLADFVKDRQLDEEDLKRVTRIALRMLDNTIDIMEFPEQFTQEISERERRIGLGIMGLADMLMKMRLPYDSAAGRKAAANAMRIINETSYDESRKLAEEKGSFPDHDKSIYKEPMRNTMRTTIAPTGSISMVYDVSGGVEPYFALQYHYEHILGGKTRMDYFNPLLEEALSDAGITLTPEERDRIKRTGSVQDLKSIPLDLRKVFRVSLDITPKNHIMMQAAMQQHVDNSISKTVNMPHDASIDDVIDAWFFGWESGLKSMTVYRDKSREMQILNLENKEGVKGDKLCPECEIPLIAGEGCFTCAKCGYGLC